MVLVHTRDGNENAIGLLSKTTSLHVHHAFFVHFFAVTARLVSRFMEDVNKRRQTFLSLSKLECGPKEIKSREIGLH